MDGILISAFKLLRFSSMSREVDIPLIFHLSRIDRERFSPLMVKLYFIFDFSLSSFSDTEESVLEKPSNKAWEILMFPFSTTISALVFPLMI